MTETLYTELAEFYDLIVDKETGKEVAFLDRVLEGESVVDLACGNGRHACALREKGYEVTGIDINREILEQARQKCGAEFVQDNLLELSLGKEFDSAILMWTTINLFERENVEKILGNVYDLLRPGGVFVLDSKPYPGDGSTESREAVEDGRVKITIESERVYSDGKRESSYRYTVEDRDTGEVENYVDEVEAWFYTEEEFREMLESSGFAVETVFDGYGDHRKGERMIFRAVKE